MNSLCVNGTKSHPLLKLGVGIRTLKDPAQRGFVRNEMVKLAKYMSTTPFVVADGLLVDFLLIL